MFESEVEHWIDKAVHAKTYISSSRCLRISLALQNLETLVIYVMFCYNWMRNLIDIFDARLDNHG